VPADPYRGEITMTTRRNLMLLSATLAAASIGGRSARAQAAAAAPLDPALAEAIALEAYVYLYPLITMEVTRRQSTNYARMGENPFRGPMNGFVHVRAFPPADFRDVVRPNFDTLYSSAWLDLRAEPMVLTVPDVRGADGRFYLMPMVDMWSNVFASPGSRTSGNGPGRFAITAPGWNGSLPAGVERIAAPTPMLWMIGRTQANGPADYPTVHRQQDGYGLTPLSRLGQAPVAPTGQVDPSVDMRTPPLTTVNTMAAGDYFRLGAALMRVHPPGAYDQPTLARMARLGIRAGEAFDIAALPPSARGALERAAAAGPRHLAASVASLGAVKNTWLYLASGMGVYGADYLRRAVVAMVGLGANVPEDAIYPLTHVSRDGRPLDGANRYLLRFPRGQEPPVDAFWSITLYDQEGFQVANPIGRFAIGDRDPLMRAADGAVEILIQNADPGADRRANWLPAPTGPFNLTMRLYGPRAEAIDGRWSPPAIDLVSPARPLLQGH
jgi:hypothetical protein